MSNSAETLQEISEFSNRKLGGDDDVSYSFTSRHQNSISFGMLGILDLLRRLTFE